MKSIWVRFRDYVENSIETIANESAKTIIPITKDVILTTGRAVVSAATNSKDISSHDLAKIALDSIHSQIPGIETSLSLAAAGLAVQSAQEQMPTK